MSADSPTLIQHHTKYLEIDGVDEIVMMTPSEHRLLHQRLRREGKCNIPPAELNRISKAAHQRTQKRKDHVKLYDKKYYAEHQDMRIAYSRKYYAEHKEECKAYNKAWEDAHKEERRIYNSRYYDAIRLEEAIK